jgi:hypothetical protein
LHRVVPWVHSWSPLRLEWIRISKDFGYNELVKEDEDSTYYVAVMATIPPAAPATAWIAESDMLRRYGDAWAPVSLHFTCYTLCSRELCVHILTLVLRYRLSSLRRSSCVHGEQNFWLPPGRGEPFWNHMQAPILICPCLSYSWAIISLRSSMSFLNPFELPPASGFPA